MSGVRVCEFILLKNYMNFIEFVDNDECRDTPTICPQGLCVNTYGNYRCLELTVSTSKYL